MSQLVERWAKDFTRRNPTLRVEASLTGSDVAMAGLYTGVADVALLGREATASELQAYEWVYRFRPSVVEIMTGSLDRAGRSPALVVFVHRDNPLASLSLAQLEAIFGVDHKRSSAHVRTWDGVGLSGEWRQQRIRLYGPMSESGTGRFFRRTVMGDSNKMNWEALTEFDDPVNPGAFVDDSGRRILDALAMDRYGMALANLQFAGPQVKAVALRVDGSSEALPATRGSVQTRRYPLARPVFAYFSRPAGKDIDPQARSFLEYVLSDAGQAVIRPEDGWFALEKTRARLQRARLK